MKIFESKISFLKWGVLDAFFFGLIFLADIDDNILFNNNSIYLYLGVLMFLLFCHFLALLFCIRIILTSKYIRFNYFFIRSKIYAIHDIENVFIRFTSTPNIVLTIKKEDQMKREVHYFFILV